MKVRVKYSQFGSSVRMLLPWMRYWIQAMFTNFRKGGICLDHVMACRLPGAKPLPEPTEADYQPNFKDVTVTNI